MRNLLKSKSAHTAREEQNGFALVIALSLMAFILLLLLSLTTMTRVESQTSRMQKELSMARGNALLGVQVALGNLQKLAGPDQRVTATADILDSLSEPNHRYWTGVWDTSTQQIHSPYVSPPQLGWLISGLDNSGDSYEPGDSIQNSITLVGPNSVLNASDEVVAGRVKLSDLGPSEKTGHYAYWIGDEGVKAKVNLFDPHRDEPSGSALEQRYSLMAAQRNAIEKIAVDDSGTQNFEDIVDPFEPENLRIIRQLSSKDEFRFLEDNSAMQAFGKYRFHDITTVGYGVPANIRDGGLKKDLSLAFEMDLSDFNSVPAFASAGEMIPALSEHPVNYLFYLTSFGAPVPLIDTPAVRGPTWHLLRNYYRLYKTDDLDRNQAYKLGNPLGVQQNGQAYRISARPAFPQVRLDFANSRIHTIPEAYYYGPDVTVNNVFESGGNAKDLPRATDMSINPVVLRMQSFLSVQAVEPGESEVVDPVDEGKYRVEVQINPVITIWNPYNVALEFETFTVRWRDYKLNLEVDSPSFSETKETFFGINNGGEAITALLMDLKNPGGGSTVLEPGEVKIYSLQNILPPSSDTQLHGECYPNTGTLESQALSNGFIFSSILGDDSGGTEALYVEPGTKLAFSVTAKTSFFLDTILYRNISGGTDGKFVSMGRFFMPSSDLTFRWPTTDATDFRSVDKILDTLPPNKHPLMVVDIRQKAASDNNPVQFLTHYNPRAANFGRSTGRKAAFGGEDIPIPGNWSIELKSLEGWSNQEISIIDDRGFWGREYSSGTSHVVFFDIPTLPMLSLAGFQHVNNLTNYAQQPAYAVGNSYASPFIPQTQLTRTIIDDGNGYTQVDWSYLSNEALWDDYFFSSLAPRPDLGQNDLGALINSYLGGLALPNSRMSLRLAEGESQADVFSKVISGSSIAPDAYRTIASNLMINGAFNVNSTSEEAWKAVLSAANGMDVEYVTGISSSTVASDQDSPYSRLSLPAGDSADDWSGFRELSEIEIERLASAIVGQVRERGPFVSLADFINRRLDDNATGRMGALQTAIENTPSINSGIVSANVTTGHLSASNLGYPENGTGPIESGATGFLRQSDLLMNLGPVLSARSDSFVIRSYGDSVDSITGETVRAWCEVVVQRSNELIDSNNDAYDEPSNYTATNREFGRKFEIVSFRWLNEDQI